MLLTINDIKNMTGGKLISRSDGKFYSTGVLTYKKAAKDNIFFTYYSEEGIKEYATRLQQFGCVVTDRNREWWVNNHRGPVILVRSVNKAIKKFARGYRTLIKAPVIAITGTAGKTTAKEMLQQILATGGSVISNLSNQNTFRGIIKALLQVEANTNFLLLEMGMDGPGQISRMCSMSKPSIGIITGVGMGHIGCEGLGSLKNIALAKSELIKGLPSNGVIFINADDANCQLLDFNGYMGRVIYFGVKSGDYRAENVYFTDKGMSFTAIFPDGRKELFEINTFGYHMVRNAMAAISVADMLLIPPQHIAEGLKKHTQRRGHQNITSGFNDSIIIDDSYHANPLSMKASLEILPHISKGRTVIAVLGSMSQLGKNFWNEHYKIGKIAFLMGVHKLVIIGNHSAKAVEWGAIGAGMKKRDIFIFSTPQEAISTIKKLLIEKSLLFIKGSRCNKLEYLVDELKKK